MSSMVASPGRLRLFGGEKEVEMGAFGLSNQSAP